jgi:hypothetical protein
MTKLYTAAFMLLLAFAACKSPQKIYDQGNYTQALERAVKKLQKDPNDEASKKVAQNAYKDAVAVYEAEISNLLQTTNEARFEQAYRQYNNLQDLYHTISQSPAAAKAVNPSNYASYIATFRNKAADLHIEKGRRWMEEISKRNAREAYYEFKAAQELKPGDADIKQMLQEAYQTAITVVLVLPLNAYGSSYVHNNSSYQMRTFQDRLIRQLNNNTQADFIHYIPEWEAQSRNMQPDQVMEMRFGRIRFGQPAEQTESRKVQKEVVVKETVYNKDSVVKEYKTVYATIATTRRTLVSEAGLLMTSRDEGGRIIWQDEAVGQHRWETRFVTYTGDERALSDKDKEALENNKPGKQRPPREDEIVDELLRQIQNDLASRLRNNYRRDF